MTKTTKQKTLMTFILSAIFLTSFGLYQQASADSPHSTLVATFGPGEDHPYTDVSESKADTVDYSASGDWFDAVEPTYMGGGAEPIPDFSETIYFGGSPIGPPVNFVKGYEEAEFTFSGLEANTDYKVTVTIDNMGDFTTAFGGALWNDADSLVPILETIFVSGNGKELGSVTAVFGDVGPGPAFNPADQTITKTLELTAESNGLGELTVGFNEYFQWDPSNSAVFNAGAAICTPDKLGATSCIGSQSGIRVAEISLLPGYAEAISATADQKGGSLKLSVTAGGDIPRFPDEFVNTEALVFGFAWADLDTGDVILATLHPQIGRDSNQNPDAWHTHPGVLEQLGQDSDFCVKSLGTSQGGIQIKGDTLSLNIAAKQAGVTVDNLDGAVGFTVVGDDDCSLGLGVNITAAPVGFS